MTDTATTIEQLATEARSHFTTSTRTDGVCYWHRTDDAPAWVADLVYAAHGDGTILPDDWRYGQIVATLDALADGADPDDGHDTADQAADVYTSERLAWLGSHLSRFEYVDQARTDYGPSPDGIAGDIAQGQYAEALEVFGQVADYLRNRADGDSCDEPETRDRSDAAIVDEIGGF